MLKIVILSLDRIWRIVFLNILLGWKCIDKYGGFAKQGYFAVFDGHGGKSVSEYSARRLDEILLKLLKQESWKGLAKSLEESFVKLDKEVHSIDSTDVGTTVCVGFITIECKERRLYIANVGDTRAVLVNSEGVKRLSYDHRLDDPREAERIKYN